MENKFLIPVDSSLSQSLLQINPDLTPQEMAGFVNTLHNVIGDHLNNGENLAFIKPNPDGTFDLTIYHFNPNNPYGWEEQK